ncbi:hypothetical protein AJ80_01668 [Polytolypa hystricis UAMH7299]|uniref:Uncharacterized protein n=1 Tax=Polytolypa hystricis (strain UAMH7299) TaxID=1447883 RepID=A0A2B7Z0W2_POLH7|nr:hypothetical protein AJ80_01668 [Polytolypa hystricis UAMH7299]
MTAPTQGIPFELRNIHEGESYINRDGTLFKYTPLTPEELPADDGEVITVARQANGKSRPHTRLFLRLQLSTLNSMVATGSIGMRIIPGSSLEKHWESLNEKTNQSLCHQTWDLIAKLRQIPAQKPELKHLFQCAADGSQTLDPLIEDFQ